MIDLEKETTDTLLSPDGTLTKDMQLEGASNDTDHNQFDGGDEVDLLGDGVQGYETTGEDGTDDDIEDELPTTPTP